MMSGGRRNGSRKQDLLIHIAIRRSRQKWGKGAIEYEQRTLRKKTTAYLEEYLKQRIPLSEAVEDCQRTIFVDRQWRRVEFARYGTKHWHGWIAGCLGCSVRIAPTPGNSTLDAIEIYSTEVEFSFIMEIHSEVPRSICNQRIDL